MKKGIKTFSYLLLLLIVLGGIGLIAFFTNGFTSDFKTFYVVYDEKRIFNSEEMSISPDNKISFEVKSLSLEKEIDYSVKIVSKTNDETAFTYFVNEEEMTYSNYLDFSSYFDVKKNDTGFSFYIPIDISMEKVLSSYYEEEIKFEKEIDIIENNYFQIVITGKGKGNEIKIAFNTKTIPVTKVEFDKNGVVF